MQISVTAMEPGFPGMVADAQVGKTTASRVNAEATAEMRFGIMVAEATSLNGCELINASNDVLAGPVVHSHAYAKPEELGDVGLKPKVVVGVMQIGAIWVLTEQTPLKTDRVRVRAVAAGNEVAGAFRVTADSTDCIDCSGFCRWTGRTGTNCAEVVVDMTNRALAVAD
jgi:hypothetical protein